MNEEQKAQAVALLAVPEIRAVAEGFRTSRLYFCVEWWVGGAKFCAPNLADETGAVEGWLHRVLERLVDKLVVVDGGFDAPDKPWFRAIAIYGEGDGWVDLQDIGIFHPTRLDAIVGALRAWVDGR